MTRPGQRARVLKSLGWGDTHLEPKKERRRQMDAAAGAHPSNTEYLNSSKLTTRVRMIFGLDSFAEEQRDFLFIHKPSGRVREQE